MQRMRALPDNLSIVHPSWFVCGEARRVALKQALSHTFRGIFMSFSLLRKVWSLGEVGLSGKTSFPNRIWRHVTEAHSKTATVWKCPEERYTHLGRFSCYLLLGFKETILYPCLMICCCLSFISQGSFTNPRSSIKRCTSGSESTSCLFLGIDPAVPL